MGSVVLNGATSGATTITPTDAVTATVTLPSTGGTLQTSGAGFTTNGVAYASSTSALTTGSALTFDGNKLSTNSLTFGYNTSYYNQDNQISNYSANNYLYVSGNGTTTGGLYLQGGGNQKQSITLDGISTGGNIVFQTNGSERARFDSSGNLLLGTTSIINAGKISISAALYTTSVGISIQNTQTTYGSFTSFAMFLNGAGVQAGNIYQSAGTTVNYNTSSDARLKEDIGVATDTSVIDNTIIHDFTWKADSRVDRGVFAQEAYEVKPSAVGIGKDDLTESGELVQPWSVDYSKYVPDLIVHAQQLKKQIQEQQTLIQSLTDRLTALENK